MRDFNNHEIHQFFADLTPDQFTANTSFFVRPLPAGTCFDGFLSEHLQVTRIAFASCDGGIFPIAALGTGKNVYYFKAEDNETLGEFIERVSTFARVHQSRWCYIFKRASASYQGEERSGLYWMAGHRKGTAVYYRHGYFEIEGQTLGSCIEGVVREDQPPAFWEILEGRVE